MYSRLIANADVRLVAAAAANRLAGALDMRDANEAAAVVDGMIASLKPHLPSEGVLPYIEELVAQPLQKADGEMLPELLVSLAQPFARLHLGDASQGLWALMSIRDPLVAAHTSAVHSIARRIANAVALEPGQHDRLMRASRIFDVGKLLVPAHLLHGAMELCNATWPGMKIHAELGADVIGRIPQLGPLQSIARAHHERYDGFGYPDGLKGEAIPIEARILAVADAWHAVISPRAYREPAPVHEAIQIVGDGRGSQWDPHIVDALLMLVWSDRPRAGRAVLRARFA